jgi:hypothetical protein
VRLRSGTDSPLSHTAAPFKAKRINIITIDRGSLNSCTHIESRPSNLNERYAWFLYGWQTLKKISKVLGFVQIDDLSKKPMPDREIRFVVG